MRLKETPEEAAFRAELRAWLAETLPDAAARAAARDDWTAKRAYDTGWQRRLFDAGLRRHHLADGVRRPGRHARPRS